MRLSVFDHADNYLFDVKDGDVFECLRTEEINGEHSLSITTVTRLQQSQRIVVGDETGTWREYVVTGVDELHSTGKRAVGTYYCVWSLQHDLSVVYGDDVEVGGETPAAAHVAMTAALTGTKRWTLGTVNVSGTATIEMFGNSAWERVGQVVSAYGGEVESRVTVDPVHGVTGRSVSLKAMVGATRVTRRFDWGGDATSIRRKPPEGARVCRIIPVGSGDDVTIADVNGGVRYLEDPEAKAAFRLPDGSGGWEYPTSVVKFDTDDDRVLLEKATRHLHDYTRPVPTYEASVLQYAEAGADMRGVNLGDPVNIVDRGFNPSAPLRLEARVVKVVTNLLDPADVQLTVGAIGAHLADYFRALDSRMQAVQTRLDAMWKEGGATPTTAEYVEWLMKQMSDRVNASGGYVYHVPGYGIRTYDKAVTDPLVGAEASKVVALTGGGIVFANSKTASGDWEWKTVIESGHIATELVTGGRITTGYIGNPVSGNYWNLETGQVRLLSGTTVEGGDATLGEIANAYGDVPMLKKGVKAVDLLYGKSNSIKTPPTIWYTDASQLWRKDGKIKGKYVWVRQKYTDYNGKPAYKDRVLSDGNQLVKRIEEQYALVKSKDNPPKESDWKSECPAYISGYYYWTRTRITWENDTVTYDPSVDGELVTAFTSVPETYDKMLDRDAIFNKLTHDGKWKGIVTDPKTGDYYINAAYIRSGILAGPQGVEGGNWWNLETGAISISAVSSLENKVANTKIGGENLLYGTKDWSGWTKRGNFVFDTSRGEASSAASAITSSNRWSKSIESPTEATNKEPRRIALYGDVRGREVTVSFDMKTSGTWGNVSADNAVNVELRLLTGHPLARTRWRVWQVKQAPTSKWQRVSMTVEAKDETFTQGAGSFSDGMYLGLVIYNRSGKQLSIRRVKLELGNVATDWSEKSDDSYLNSMGFSRGEVAAYDAALTHTKAFNKLTNNGAVKGLFIGYMNANGTFSKTYKSGWNPVLYMNADYIRTGTLDANLIRTGILSGKGSTADAPGFYLNFRDGFANLSQARLDGCTIEDGSLFLDDRASNTVTQLRNGRITLHKVTKRDKSGHWSSMTEKGRIDLSANIDIVGNVTERVLKSVNGLLLNSPDLVEIASKRVSVRRKGKSGTLAFTGSVMLNKLTFNGDQVGVLELKFENGLFTGVGEHTSYVRATKQEGDGQ